MSATASETRAGKPRAWFFFGPCLVRVDTCGRAKPSPDREKVHCHFCASRFCQVHLCWSNGGGVNRGHEALLALVMVLPIMRVVGRKAAKGG